MPIPFLDGKNFIDLPTEQQTAFLEKHFEVNVAGENYKALPDEDKLKVKKFFVDNKLGKLVNAKDSGRLVGLGLLGAVDYAQSKSLFKKPGHHEMNPLLSRKPSDESLAGFGVAGVGAAYLLSKNMKDGKFKDLVMDSIVESEKFNVEENMRIKKGGKRQLPAIMIKANWKF